MNIKEFDVVMAGNETVTMVEIETSEGNFTQMPKSVYEAQQVAQVPTIN